MAKLMGWRACILAGSTLHSPHYGTPWISPVLRADRWSTKAAVRGEAGIHAATSPHGDLPEAKGAMALMRVETVGDYVRGDEGWRAEAVIVRAVIAPWWTTDQTMAEIATRYQCPVTRRRPYAYR
jgi:hypothetical protein